MIERYSFNMSSPLCYPLHYLGYMRLLTAFLSVTAWAICMGVWAGCSRGGIGCIAMYAARESLGLLFGASNEVNVEIERIMPVFLVSVPFVAVNRITTASFYATEKSTFSYILTFIEPLFMLVLMLILPPLFGGQLMIWWSTVFARVLSAILAIVLKKYVDRKEIMLTGRTNHE